MTGVCTMYLGVYRHVTKAVGWTGSSMWVRRARAWCHSAGWFRPAPPRRESPGLRGALRPLSVCALTRDNRPVDCTAWSLSTWRTARTLGMGLVNILLVLRRMRCVPLRSLRHCRERSQTQPQLARHLVHRLHRPCIHRGTDICMFTYSHNECCARH